MPPFVQRIKESQPSNASAAIPVRNRGGSSQFQDQRAGTAKSTGIQQMIHGASAGRSFQLQAIINRAQARENKAPSENNAGQGVVQRVIAQTFAQHAGVAPVGQASVDAYWNYIKTDFNTARNKFKDPDMPTRAHLQSLYLRYLAAYGLARGGHAGWAPVVMALDNLMPVINEGLEFSDHDNHQKEKFSNARDDSWNTAEEGVTAMQGVVDNHSLGNVTPKRPRGRGAVAQPNAPKIGWSQAKLVMPSAQRDLIWQIYLSWKYGKVLDRRTKEEKAGKTKNSSTPGALRSWHMNEQNQLPDIEDAQIPGHAQGLHDHYLANSKKPYDEPADGPVGYAEYTGTGIYKDAHNSKIVLDYKTGQIFLTLSHYKLWNKGHGGVPDIKDKKAGSGSQSAWFCIDMTH